MGQASSIDTPEDEFYRPRTPLRFGSVPTALPVDPREYNIRERESSVYGASVSSFNDVFPAILSQESFLDMFDDERASPFSPSTLSGQSFSDGHEGSISPLTRSKGSPMATSLKGTHCCEQNGRGVAITGFQTEEELKDHNCSTGHGCPANNPVEEATDDIPFYFFPTLCMEGEVTPAKPGVSSNTLATKSRRTRPPRLPRPPGKPLPGKRRRITPPPPLPPPPPPPAAPATAPALPSSTSSRLTHSPRRRASKLKLTRPPTPLPQQRSQPTTQCECPQCERRASSAYPPPTQYTTPAPRQPPPQPAPLPTTHFQAPLWQIPATFTAAVTGMQALPMQYERQLLPHMQQQQAVSSQIGQRGASVWNFLPSNDAADGVY